MTTKERPILFSGPMVRALLDGRKTQTDVLYLPHALQRQAKEGGARSRILCRERRAHKGARAKEIPRRPATYSPPPLGTFSTPQGKERRERANALRAPSLATDCRLRRGVLVLRRSGASVSRTRPRKRRWSGAPQENRARIESVLRVAQETGVSS